MSADPSSSEGKATGDATASGDSKKQGAKRKMQDPIAWYEGEQKKLLNRLLLKVAKKNYKPAKSDDKKPKKKTGYIIYSQKVRSEMKEPLEDGKTSGESLQPKEMMKKVAAMWKALSKKEQLEYQKMADEMEAAEAKKRAEAEAAAAAGSMADDENDDELKEEGGGEEVAAPKRKRAKTAAPRGKKAAAKTKGKSKNAAPAKANKKKAAAEEDDGEEMEEGN